MDTYLFSIFLKGLLVWESIPRKQPYKLIGMTSSTMLLRGNKETCVLQVKIKYPHETFITTLNYFIENKGIHIFFVCPLSQRFDVLACSTSFHRSLKENGTLLREFEILQFLSVWRERIAYLPQSGLQCSDIITNSCDVQILFIEPVCQKKPDDMASLQKIGCVEEFPSFGIFDHEYNYAHQTFSRINPGKMPKLKSIRGSIILMPLAAPMTSIIPLLREMHKKLHGLSHLTPQFDDGRRIKCSLVLDEDAPKVDTRLLTPGNLEILEVLFMTSQDYFQWVSASREKYSSLESSVWLREAVHKSTMDFRFSPPPFMYIWKVFVCNSKLKRENYVMNPCSEWSCLALNSNAMEYCRKSIGYETLHQVRTSSFPLFFRECERFEYFNALESSMLRVPFTKSFVITVHKCDVGHAYEKNFEKVFKDKPADSFMASMGFLRKPQTMAFIPLKEEWDAKQFNLRIRKTAGYIYSDFIEDCFEGFSLDNAKNIISSNPNECVICCTNSVNVLLESCGHSFCLNCINTMLDTGSSQNDILRKVQEPCPNCRTMFSKDSLIQFKQYKTTRKKSKEDTSLTRKRALLHLLNLETRAESGTESLENLEPPTKLKLGRRPRQSSKDTQHISLLSSEESELEKDMDCAPFYEDKEAIKSKEGLKIPNSQILIVVPYEEVRDTILLWYPGVHCTSLQKLYSDLSKSNLYSRIIMISPLMNIDTMDYIHCLFQKYCSDQITLDILALNFGQHCEDFSWVSTFQEFYSCVETSVSTLIL